MTPHRPEHHNFEPLLSVFEVAVYCQVDTETVYRWLRNQQLRGLRAGDQWRIKRADLDRFLGDIDDGMGNTSSAPIPDPSAVA